MPTMCIQCALRAMLDNQPAPVFEETPEEHRARVHPDQEETQRERERLERELSRRLRRENDNPTR